MSMISAQKNFVKSWKHRVSF
uniref:Uncharacterized protein MANES_04G137700 n=1 Tax=Rhizophora mucronata TaxID=61149 RepID=A0A2P2JDW5_RHIMU